MKKTSISLNLKSTRATAPVAPDMLKALIIRTATTIKRSAVKQEDLHTYWKSVKKDHISQDNQRDLLFTWL